MVPDHIKTLEVVRNDAGEVVRMHICDGKYHFVVKPIGVRDNKHFNNTVCEESHTEVVDFPQDVVTNLHTCDEVRLGLVGHVPDGYVLVYDVEGKRYFSNAKAVVALSRLANGMLLGEGEYVYRTTGKISEFILRISHPGVLYNSHGTGITLIGASTYSNRKLRKMLAEMEDLGLKRHVPGQSVRAVFTDELATLQAKRVKFGAMTSTPKVQVILAEIDSTIALIMQLPQHEISARADDLAEFELDEVLAIQANVQDRLAAQGPAWDSIQALAQSYINPLV